MCALFPSDGRGAAVEGLRWASGTEFVAAAFAPTPGIETAGDFLAEIFNERGIGGNASDDYSDCNVVSIASRGSR